MEPVARRAALLRFRAGRSEATIDAIVVATAELVGGQTLLTHDPDDCSVIASPTNVRAEMP